MGFQDLNVSKQILMALEEAGFDSYSGRSIFNQSFREGFDRYRPDRYGKDAGLPDPDVDETALRAGIGSAGIGDCSHAGIGGAGV